MNGKLSIVLIFILLGGCVSQRAPEATEDSGELTFIVTVPENTPEEDIVYIETYQPQGIEGFAMERIGPFTHKISFSQDELEQDIDEEGNPIVKYRYTRNNWGYITAEYRSPDTFEHLGSYLDDRSAPFQPGSVREDFVERWRWFPDGEIQKTSTISPPGEFRPRVDGIEFRSGQVLQDLYSPAFDDFFDSTAQHMKEQGYTWVIIEPPWDWVQTDPLPKVGNPVDKNPNYPDEKLLKHIKAFKDAGFKVMLGPQVCCTMLDFENRSQEWWEAYFAEMERFLIHHAKLAEEADVDAFFYAIGNDGQGSGLDIDTKWRNIWQKVKQEYSGEVGEMVWNFQLVPEDPHSIIPTADSISWGDELDFFVFQSDAAISMSTNPTDGELKESAGEVLDGAKQLYDVHKKPVIVQSTYAAVNESWKGAFLYDISLMGAPWVRETDWQGGKYAFSGEDQARVVNAYFEAIEERPWITGYAQFGYWHWEMPLAPDMSVRGKPAEDVWVKWNSILNK